MAGGIPGPIQPPLPTGSPGPASHTHGLPPPAHHPAPERGVGGRHSPSLAFVLPRPGVVSLASRLRCGPSRGARADQSSKRRTNSRTPFTDPEPANLLRKPTGPSERISGTLTWTHENLSDLRPPHPTSPSSLTRDPHHPRRSQHSVPGATLPRWRPAIPAHSWPCERPCAVGSHWPPHHRGQGPHLPPPCDPILVRPCTHRIPKPGRRRRKASHFVPARSTVAPVRHPPLARLTLSPACPVPASVPCPLSPLSPIAGSFSGLYSLSAGHPIAPESSERFTLWGILFTLGTAFVCLSPLLYPLFPPPPWNLEVCALPAATLVIFSCWFPLLVTSIST